MSTPPTPYTRSYDFTGWQLSHPAEPLPAAQVDTQLNSLSSTTSQLISRLAEIQRDDGALFNHIVTQDSLSTALITYLVQIASAAGAAAGAGTPEGSPGQPLDPDLTAIGALATTGFLKRTGDAAWSLLAALAISDVTGLQTALDAKANAADVTAIDLDLAAIAALTGTGFLKRTATNAWSLLSALAISDITALQDALDLKAPISAATGYPFRDLQAADFTSPNSGYYLVTAADMGTKIILPGTTGTYAIKLQQVATDDSTVPGSSPAAHFGTELVLAIEVNPNITLNVTRVDTSITVRVPGSADNTTITRTGVRTTLRFSTRGGVWMLEGG